MNVRTRLSSILGALSLAAASVSVAQENYAQWSKYRTLTVNTSATGANTTTGVGRYPLLVRLDSTAADVFAGAKANGVDVRFTTVAGVRLSHERERWDSAGRVAEFWVRLDTLAPAAAAAQTIRIYWGKADATDSSSGPSVFRPADGWKAVWHMNETITTNADSAVDATGQGNKAGATLAGTATFPFPNATGAIGLGKSLGAADATNGRYFNVPDLDSSLNLNTNTGPITLSGWANVTTCAQGSRSAIIGKYNGTSTAQTRQFALQIAGGAANWSMAANPTSFYNTAGVNEFVAGQACTINTWQQVTGVYQNGPPSRDAAGATATTSVYVNGTGPGTVSTASQTSTDIGTSSPFLIGAVNNGAGFARFLRGGVDEVRVSSVARSADWAKLDYEIQRAGGTTLALGATTSQGPVTNFAYGDAAKAADTVVWYVGIAVNLMPTYTGGPIDSCAITSAQTSLPTGMTFNKLTCSFTGTPTATIAAANRTITAYSSFGNVTRVVRRSAALAPASNLDYAVDTAVYVANLPINANTPSSDGRSLTAYTITPTLPAGLALNPTTGVISGTPTGAVAAANYTVQGTNTVGPDSLTKQIRITVTTSAAEDYAGSAWPNKQVIWLNTQSNGAAVTAGLAKFPTLIRLDSANFNAGFGQAAAGGADIRFTKPNNTTRLPHQIERWDAAAKKAEIWVLVDTVKGSALDSIRMHWGNATAPNLSSGPTVFDTANGYEGVWHMNAASGGEADATPNAFAATHVNNPTSGVGAAGPARVFNGTNQYFTVPGSVTGRMSFSLDQSYTLSGWVNPSVITTATGNGHKIVEKGDEQWTLATYGSGSDPKYWEITTKMNNGAAIWAQAASGPIAAGANTQIGATIIADSGIGKWTYITGIYRGAATGSAMAETLYVNGAPAASRIETLSGDNTTSRVLTFQVHIGAQTGTAPSGGTVSRQWNGFLDEIRVQSRARSAAWIKLEHANQRPAAQVFVSFTRPGIVSVKGSLAGRTGGDLSMKSVGRGLAFRLATEPGFTASLALVDVWGRSMWSGNFVNGALTWDGRTSVGADAAPGLYLARVIVRDAEGRQAQVLNFRVPFTR